MLRYCGSGHNRKSTTGRGSRWGRVLTLGVGPDIDTPTNAEEAGPNTWEGPTTDTYRWDRKGLQGWEQKGLWEEDDKTEDHAVRSLPSCVRQPFCKKAVGKGVRKMASGQVRGGMASATTEGQLRRLQRVRQLVAALCLLARCPSQSPQRQGKRFRSRGWGTRVDLKLG